MATSLVKLGCALAALAVMVCARAQTDCGMQRAFSFQRGGKGTTWVLSSPDGSVMWTGPLAIDLDGAPNAYHPQGRSAGALETICNGANVRLPDGTRIQGSSDCSAMIPKFNEARDSGWTAAGKPRVEWYGVAAQGDTGEAKYKPCVQDQGPFAGFFVAQTALLVDPARGRCDTARYANPLVTPYYVLPRACEFQKRGFKRGDVAAVMSATGNIAFGVYGDTGPADGLGEGSLALASQLRGQPVPARPTRDDVRSAAFGGGVTFLVFKDSDPGAPYTAERIAERGQERLKAWGGDSRLKACSGK